MAKEKPYELKTPTDIKIFVLFLLDQIRYPIEYTTLSGIIYDHIGTPSMEYEQALASLVDEGRVIMDAFDGERYYMISPEGHLLSAELYDTLDPLFREKAIKIATRRVKLSAKNMRVSSSIRKDETGRFAVTLYAEDGNGEIMNMTLTVPDRQTAELIRETYENRPDSVYRGIMISATGRIGYIAPEV